MNELKGDGMNMKVMQKNLLFMMLILFLFSACTTTKVIVPPVTSPPTNTHLAGQFVWYDLITSDVPAAKKFYGGLLGWEFEAAGKDATGYTIINADGTPVGGIIYSERAKKIDGEQWLSYLSVPDVDRAVDITERRGGKVLVEAFEFEARGRTAVVADPQGALVVLFKSYGGDPPMQTLEERLNHVWIWTELFTNDTEASSAYYEEIAGYQTEKLDSGVNVPYYVFRKGEKGYAGMLTTPWENVKPNWLPYIKVKDPDAIVKKVESLGGMVILAPGKDIRNGSVAIVTDPTGAAIALQKYPFKD
jgi:predicted enzyme related to lactoylglutathione lyase